jgi:hypothetical protein
MREASGGQNPSRTGFAKQPAIRDLVGIEAHAGEASVRFVVPLALGLTACVAVDSTPQFVYAPPQGAPLEQVAVWNTECQAISETAEAPPSNPPMLSDNQMSGTGVGGVIGATVGSAVASEVARPQAEANVRWDSLELCYEGRGYRVVELTREELAQYRRLDTLEARQAFAQSVAQAHPERTE